MVSISPLNDRVIVKIEEEEKSAGGIILTGSAKTNPAWATVAAVGPGTDEVKMILNVGDKVIYPKDCGTKMGLDGVDYLIFKQDEILAIVEEVIEEEEE